MSRIGNHRVGLQENPHYQLGREHAEQGCARIEGPLAAFGTIENLQAHQLGWDDYHAEERQP